MTFTPSATSVASFISGLASVDVLALLSNCFFQFLDHIVLVLSHSRSCLNPWILSPVRISHWHFNYVLTGYWLALCPSLCHSPALERIDYISVYCWLFCWAVGFNCLLSCHDWFENDSSTLTDMAFKFAWANHRWWMISLFEESVLPYRAFARTSWSTWAAVDDGAILTLGHMALAFILFSSKQIFSLNLDRIDLPTTLLHSWLKSTWPVLRRRICV